MKALIDRSQPYIVYGVLALAILLPLLGRGYVLTLDMVFTPNLPMPESIGNNFLWYKFLHVLNLFIPSDILQKIMLLAILGLSGLGMHYLVRYIQMSKNAANEFAAWGAYIAGTLYMINPFTYSRFMAGQYGVLLGYALLPFFARALLRFSTVPTLSRGLGLGLWLTVIGILSLHTLGLAIVLIIASLAICVWRCRDNRRITLSALLYWLAGIALFIVASGYWLFPLVAGTSNQSQAAMSFSTGDQQAFATVGNGWAGKLGNVLQLQGFWAESEAMYLLPQEQLPGWMLVVLGIWVLVGLGVAWTIRHHRDIAFMYIGAGVLAILLAIVGTGNSHVLSGFREPQKFIGLLALAYSIFAGLGAAALLHKAKKHSETLCNVAAIFVLLLPILFMPTMFWGFAGQLSPRQYPPDWYSVNDWLNQDHTSFRVLSLPWHLYMHYPFAGRIIANPTEDFFDKPTLVSNELEHKKASPTSPNADKKQLTKLLPAAADNPGFGDELSALDIKYVLLAKTYDYKEYAYLDHHPDLQLVMETRNLKLYRNLAYGQ